MQRLRLWLIVAAMVFVAGCATQNVSHAPGADVGTIKTFYVQKLAADQRGIDQLFVKQLSAWGYTATAGIEDKPSTPVDSDPDLPGPLDVGHHDVHAAAERSDP